MALQLEQDIMNAIGLGNHYNWYGGSGSCRGRRLTATAALPKAIQDARDAGEEIIPPDDEAIRYARNSERHETSEYSLKETWIAISYVIQWHINQYANRQAVNTLSGL